jgi:hypothetical protein
MCGQSAWSDTGCLISYEPSRLHSFRRAAIYVDKILKGGAAIVSAHLSDGGRHRIDAVLCAVCLQAETKTAAVLKPKSLANVLRSAVAVRCKESSTGFAALLFTIGLTDLAISCDVLLYALRRFITGDFSLRPRRFFLAPRLLHEPLVTGNGQSRLFLNSKTKHLSCQIVQTLRELSMALSLPLIKGSGETVLKFN